MERLPDIITAQSYPPGALRREINADELTRIRPGAYLESAQLRDAPAWKVRQTRILAGCLAAADKLTTTFAFSDETAATLHEWSTSTIDDSISIVQRHNPCAGPPGLVRRVDPRAVATRILTEHGLPVTPPEQTVLDCARLLPPDRALIVVDSAFNSIAEMSYFREKRRASLDRQARLRASLLEQLAQLGPVRGVVQARAILEHADGFGMTPGESRSRWIALRGGLPVPTCQYELVVDGKVYFADMAWTGVLDGMPWLVIAEFDGDIKYRGAEGPRVVSEEKAREDAIRRRHGAYFARLTTADNRRPDHALRLILEAFPDGSVPVLEPRRLLSARPSAGARRRRDRGSGSTSRK